RENQRWYAGETISVAVGQGYNSFTLLQLAQATSTLANNGYYRKPHLVHAVRDPLKDGKENEVIADGYQIPLKQANLDVVKHAMADVVKSGTARRAFANTPYQAAGKTGTAQVYSLRGAKYRADKIDERLRDHALFMGFAPADNPRIAVALIVENAGWGASSAAPVARKIFDHWLVGPTAPAPVELDLKSVGIEGGQAAQAAAARLLAAEREQANRP
ncbi:MAG: penicillin-binding protein 2, partial [Comamonadaceae bacterium]